MTVIDRRTRDRAEKLWRQAGSPTSGTETYFGRARELIAIEDNPPATEPIPPGSPDNPPHASADTSGPTGEPVEEVQEAIDNEGEFPTLTDQGEGEAGPHRRKRAGR